MKWFSTIVFVAFLAAQSASAANPMDVQAIVSVFVAACSVETPGNLSQTQVGNGVTRQFMMRTGAPPGTEWGQVTVEDQHFSIVAREERDGFCALRFEPQVAAAVQAELGRRFQTSSEPEGWRVHRPDGDGLIAYRPFASGLRGPAWISRPGAYMFGFDAAERDDTLVFYAPPIT